MNYEDTVLLTLADPTSRAGVFDDTGLAQMVAAAYDSDALGAAGPYQANFDELRFGYAVSQIGIVDGYWQADGQPTRTAIRLQLSGIGPAPPLRIDALWRGSVVASVSPPSGSIVDFSSGWPSLGTIDSEIIEEDGALPTDPAALETARRSVFLARLQAAMSQPDLFTLDALGALIQSAGADSIDELIERQPGSVSFGGARITLSPGATVPPAARSLPITAAILIRDAGFSISQLLMDSKLMLEQLADAGVDPVRDSTLPMRRPILIVWIVPAATFDDSGWPGATAEMTPEEMRDARREAAAQWLTDEGIAVFVTP